MVTYWGDLFNLTQLVWGTTGKKIINFPDWEWQVEDSLFPSMVQCFIVSKIFLIITKITPLEIDQYNEHDVKFIAWIYSREPRSFSVQLNYAIIGRDRWWGNEKLKPVYISYVIIHCNITYVIIHYYICNNTLKIAYEEKSNRNTSKIGIKINNKNILQHSK